MCYDDLLLDQIQWAQSQGLRSVANALNQGWCREGLTQDKAYRVIGRVVAYQSQKLWETTGSQEPLPGWPSGWSK